MLDFRSWLSGTIRHKDPAGQIFLPPDPSRAPRVLYTGYQHCPQGHFHSGYRPHALLHVVLRGRGSVRVGSRSDELGVGQACLFFPNQPFHYRSSESDPWSYVWAGMGGEETEEWLRLSGMSPERPVIKIGLAIEELENLCAVWFARLDAANGNVPSLLRLARIGAFEVLEVLDAAAHKAGWSRDRVLTGMSHPFRIKQFLEENYSRPLTTTMVAKAVNLNRSYCCRLFAAEFGQGIMEWLTDFRLKRAAELLISSGMTLSHVAGSVGLGVSTKFSRIFKRRYGMSPGAWRKAKQAGRW
jgi:AraC-like DNA-binding protein/mannose-6-phosphate isomerase-like protein (cupin superfamily)